MHRFSGNPLNRSATNKKLVGFLLECIDKPNGKWILYRNMKIYFQQQINGVEDIFQLKYATLDEILRVFQLEDKDQLLQYFFDNIVILGEMKDEWYFAINISHLTNEEVSYIAQNSNTTVFSNTVEVEGRKLLVGVSQEDAAISGQVLSLFNFHKAHQYLGFTGEITRSIEGGHKRMGLDSGLKVYPRLDPVMIACVVSPDFKYCLLGHMKHFPQGFYSCLSGFVEPCESVQEAVVREIKEESGVVVNTQDVYIIDSQPWPIGRGGGCELMIGCLAIAKTTEIIISEAEVEDVQWFSLPQIKRLIDKYAAKSSQSIKTEMKSWEDSQLKLSENITRSSHSSSSASSSSHSSSHSSDTGEGESNDDGSLFAIDDEEIESIRIPGDYAIAHHLLRRYVNKEYDMYLYKKTKKEMKSAVVIKDNDNTNTNNSLHTDPFENGSRETNSTTCNNLIVNRNNDLDNTTLLSPSPSSSSNTDIATTLSNNNMTITTVNARAKERFWMWTTVIATSTALVTVSVTVYVLNGGRFRSLQKLYNQMLSESSATSIKKIFSQRIIIVDSAPNNSLAINSLNSAGLEVHCAK